MKKLKSKWKSLTLIAVFIVAMVVWGFIVIPNVFAEEPKTISVPPGAGTLKAAVAQANPGDTLKLTAGSYTGEVSAKTVEINKKLTIEGAGRSTIIDVPIKITGVDTKEITLKGFTSSSQPPEADFMFIQVDGKANLTIDDVRMWGILRGQDGQYPRHDSTVLDVTEKGNDSIIKVQNCSFDKPGTHYGIAVKSSNTQITVDNSTIAGRTAIILDSKEKGENNIINITNGSRIVGPSSIYTDTDGIIINSQDGLKFTVDNSTVKGSMNSGDKLIKLFSFGSGEKKSTNVKIDIKNESNIYDQDKISSSRHDVIFAFAEDNSKNDNNVVTIDKTSKIYLSIVDNKYTEDHQEEIPVSRKYSTVSNSAVIGIYDREGNGEIKLYSNGDSIPELKQDKYVKLDGYRFKGWFKDNKYQSEYQKQEDDYPNALNGDNMDLYAKLVKEVKVTIGEKAPHVIEEGQTLADIEEAEEELEELKVAGKNLKGYIMHGATGGDISYTTSQLEDLKNIPITEDVKIEAVHYVTLTVNGTQFDVDTGETVEEIGTHSEDESYSYKGTQEEYQNAKLNKREEKEFARLIYKNNGETFDEKTPITENTEVVTKHYAIVTIEDNDTEYFVEEGKKLSEDRDNALLPALKSLKELSVKDKTFNRFENTKKEKININEGHESVISESTQIRPIYEISVKIDDTSYTLEEGQSLSNLTSKQEEIKNKLKALLTAAGERHFKGFVISDSDKQELIGTSKEEAETTINEKIITKEFSKNTTIFAEYNAEVKIKCFDDSCGGKGTEKTFEIDTGKTLQDIEDKVGYEKAKYQQYNETENKEERFSRFVIDKTDEEFKETDEIAKSITLVPKYYAYVTINDERVDSKNQYKVEQGKGIEDLVGERAKEVLAMLQTDITPEDSDDDGENLHFEKLVKSGTEKEEVPKQITEDISIEGLYHYDVIIVEDYDNPGEKAGDDHSYGFKVYRGETFNSTKEVTKGKISNALNMLKSSATKTEKNRKFYSYWETNTNKEFSEEQSQNEELFNTAFNKHIYITAKVSYKVEVDGDEKKYYVVENNPISSNSELTKALESLQKETKNLVKYTVNDSEVENEEAVKNTPINNYTKIGAKYEVTVKIGNKTFTLPEGGKLSDLTDQTDEIDAALRDLKKQTIKEGQNFKGYIDSEGSNFTTETTVSKNTEISTVYNIKVTILIDKNEQNKKYFEIDSGKTLSDIAKNPSYSEDYENIKKKTNRKFSRFIDEDNNSIDEEETRFTKNVILIPIFSVSVTVKDTPYYVDENANMESNSKLMEALKAFEVEGKQLSGYVYGEANTSITTKSPINDNITIKPVYTVKLIIQYNDEIIKEFDNLPDGKSINDSTDRKEEMTAALNTLKKKVTDDGYNFNEFVSNGTTFDENTKLDKNTTVTAKYNIKVKIQGGTTSGEFEIESNGTLADVKTANSTLFENVQKKDGRTFLHFAVDEDTVLKADDNKYQFTKNTTLTAKFAVTITINGKEYPLEEGKSLSSDAEIVSALKTLEKENQRLVEYRDEEDGSIIATVEDIENKKDKTINKNIKIQPKYLIDIEIVGDEIYQNTVESGTQLKDVGYTKPDKFKKFVDYETGKAVDENTKLEKHTKLKAIYEIIVTIGGKEYKLNSFQKFKNLNDLEGADEDLKDLKENIPDGRKSFSRFVYMNSKGEEIELKDDTEITTDITIVPKFTVEITVVYTTSDGTKEELVTLELEEGKSISDLSKDELEKLTSTLSEIETQFEKEGKHNFKFSKFITNEGSNIDVKTTKFNEKTTIEAVFEYKEDSTPTKPNHSNNDYPLKEKAPNTGVTNAVLNIDTVIGTIIAIFVALGSGFASYKKYLSINSDK